MVADDTTNTPELVLTPQAVCGTLCETELTELPGSWEELQQLLTAAHVIGRSGRGLHGSNGRYANGCRCELCREARRVYVAEWRAKRRLSESSTQTVDG